MNNPFPALGPETDGTDATNGYTFFRMFFVNLITLTGRLAERSGLVTRRIIGSCSDQYDPT